MTTKILLIKSNPQKKIAPASITQKRSFICQNVSRLAFLPTGKEPFSADEVQDYRKDHKWYHAKPVGVRSCPERIALLGPFTKVILNSRERRQECKYGKQNTGDRRTRDIA